MSARRAWPRGAIFGADMNVLAVGELTGYLAELFDTDPVLRDLWVRGEVSNFTRSGAGHCYFTLKDDESQVRCVLFRGDARWLPFAPKNGDFLLAHGRVCLYEPRGEYQLKVDLVQPDGVGPLQLAFEELRRRLEEEGLFDERRKRPLPAMPRCIGVVTSATGAVWHDIQTVIARRYPLAEVVLAPATVQGEDAPASIAAGIRALCAEGRAEVLIVGRGGGSAEDLWAFNDERVARAIFAASVPVISGVGHEVDVTIADFVADLRAPTPSAAAELCVPDCRELAGRVEAARLRLGEVLADRTDEAREAVGRATRGLDRTSPQRRIDEGRQRLDGLTHAAGRALAHGRELQGQRVAALGRQLAALDPRAVLGRGYAVVTDEENGAVVGSGVEAWPGRALRIAVADGTFPATVAERPAARLAPNGRSARANPAGRAGGRGIDGEPLG